MFRAISIGFLMIRMFSGLSTTWAHLEGPRMDMKHISGIPKGFNPERLFEKFGSKYYYIPDEEYVTWYAALHNCHSIGGHLLSLTQIDTLYEISKHVRNTTSSINYWVDLNDIGKEGEYLSMSSGVKPYFVDWCENQEPIKLNTTENCVNIENPNKLKPCMKSISCDFFRTYICQSNTPRTFSIAVW